MRFSDEEERWLIRLRLSVVRNVPMAIVYWAFAAFCFYLAYKAGPRHVMADGTAVLTQRDASALLGGAFLFQGIRLVWPPSRDRLVVAIADKLRALPEQRSSGQPVQTT